MPDKVAKDTTRNILIEMDIKCSRAEIKGTIKEKNI